MTVEGPPPGGEPAGRAGLHVLLVTSNGGHLAQLLALRPWWETRRRTWVTHDKADARSLLAAEAVVWAFHPTTRHVPNMLRNARLAWRALRELRPDLVVSTGAGVAVPFFACARLLGIATCYIETYDRLETRSMSGRLCRPFTDLLLLQWPEQQRAYPSGIVIGRLL